jgi:hypothetical protein
MTKYNDHKTFKMIEEHGMCMSELADLINDNRIYDEDGMPAGWEEDVIEHKGIKINRVSTRTIHRSDMKPKRKKVNWFTWSFWLLLVGFALNGVFVFLGF